VSGKALAEHIPLRALITLLEDYSYRYSSEVRLHESLSQVLSDAGFDHVREHRLDEKNRADFWLPQGEDGGIVIEVKVDGSLAEAYRQVARYIDLPQVRGVLLASTVRWAAEVIQDRPHWKGKAFGIAYLRRQAL
jgi:hypothetical protein